MDTAGRDRGLQRLSHLTRGCVAGAVALTGVLSVVVAHARPGKSASSATSATTPTTAASTGDGTLQAPVQVPTRSSGRGAATSGAS